jgi:hypothetical protein
MARAAHGREAERVVGAVRPTIIRYRWPNVSTAWRYASESELHYDHDPEALPDGSLSKSTMRRRAVVEGERSGCIKGAGALPQGHVGKDRWAASAEARSSPGIFSTWRRCRTRRTVKAFRHRLCSVGSAHAALTSYYTVHYGIDSID